MALFLFGIPATVWKKSDISTASAQLFRNTPGRMRHFPTLCGKVCGKEVSFPQTWGKLCGKGVENAVRPSRDGGKCVHKLYIFACGCPVGNTYSTPVDMSGFGGQRYISAARCGGSVRIFSTDRGGQPLSHTDPFFHRKCCFLIHSDSICPQGSGCHPLFGHGQDISQIVHGLSTAFFTGAGRLTAGKSPDRQGFSVFPQYPAPLLLLLLKDIRIDR